MPPSVSTTTAPTSWRASRPPTTSACARGGRCSSSRSNTYVEVGLGCDFYLPFFKLIPELKFCFGLANLLKKDRPDLGGRVVAEVHRGTRQGVVAHGGADVLFRVDVVCRLPCASGLLSVRTVRRGFFPASSACPSGEQLHHQSCGSAGSPRLAQSCGPCRRSLAAGVGGRPGRPAAGPSSRRMWATVMVSATSSFTTLASGYEVHQRDVLHLQHMSFQPGYKPCLRVCGSTRPGARAAGPSPAWPCPRSPARPRPCRSKA